MKTETYGQLYDRLNQKDAEILHYRNMYENLLEDFCALMKAVDKSKVVPRE